MDVNKIIEELQKITNVRVFENDEEFIKSRADTKLLAERNKIVKLKLGYCKDDQIRIILEKVAKLESLQNLYLRSTPVTHIPEIIGQVTSLETLHLRCNKIVYIPETIGQLALLKTLDLSHNKITHLPNTIVQLKSLQALYLCGNKISHIPETIGELTSLRTLDLRFTQINNIPDTIRQLTSLQNLDLSYNKITHIPQVIAQLNSLQTLELNNNQISKIPVELCKLKQLTTINVKENPLIEPPIEIYTQGSNAILEYLKAKSKDSVKVYEAKLMIVGEPGAGKTTLRKKLLDPNAQLPRKVDTTEGIDIAVWKYPYKKENYTVNLWDFGGQEIYRSTHQFFMSERVLYVLLADSREEKTDYFDWLHRIELFADDSPVVIVHNEIDDRVKKIDMPTLRQSFPYINEPLRCNLAKIINTEREEDFFNIVNEIKRRISELSVIGQEFPKTWIELRQELESLVERKKLNYISSDTYYNLCKKHEIEQSGALVLGKYLHSIGTILFFSDDEVLKNTVILNPEWGTDAVYKVIDDNRVQSRFGRFTLRDVKRIWCEKIYNNKFHELLQLMKNFRICYKTYQEDFYILPQLLEYPPEEYKWEHKAILHFEYRYSGYYLKSIMYHFIVAMHQYIQSSRVWRNCVVLKKDDISAEVKADENKKSIYIRVSGLLCNDFLANIRYEFERIHADYPKLKVESMIPCNCDICKDSEEPVLFKYSELYNRLMYGKDTIDCSKNKYCAVEIEPLIRDFPEIDIGDNNERITREEINHMRKEMEEMKNANKGDVINNYGYMQNKGKNNSMTINVSIIENTINELKEAITKEDLGKEVKEQILAVIEQIEDNDYELKPKVKVRLKDKLRDILQDVANGTAVGGVIIQLISMLGG